MLARDLLEMIHENDQTILEDTTWITLVCTHLILNVTNFAYW